MLQKVLWEARILVGKSSICICSPTSVYLVLFLYLWYCPIIKCHGLVTTRLSGHSRFYFHSSRAIRLLYLEPCRCIDICMTKTLLWPKIVVFINGRFCSSFGGVCSQDGISLRNGLIACNQICRHWHICISSRQQSQIPSEGMENGLWCQLLHGFMQIQLHGFCAHLFSISLKKCNC